MKLAGLEAALDYQFKDSGLLQQALTHRSLGEPHYERLEFLGDGLINFVIGEAVYQARPGAPEGDLSRLRASLVREETLADLAQGLSLGDYIQLGSGELKSGGFRRRSILADALEAVIGAIHLDGGFAPARAVCLRLYHERLGELPDPESLKDAKTRLQEILQSHGRPVPEYAVAEVSGPPHRQTFRVHCRLPDAAGQQTEARGGSRRQAEQNAAQRMIERLTGVSP